MPQIIAPDYRPLLVSRPAGPQGAIQVLLRFRPDGYPGGWWSPVLVGYSFATEADANAAIEMALRTERA